jgi:hypothetical protein
MSVDSPPVPSRAAQQLGADVHTQAVNAFTDAMATGFRVVAMIVVIAAIAVASGLSRSSAQT